jgi:diacylglycerol kinase (ATP)
MRRGILVYNPTAGQRDRRHAMRRLAQAAREEGLELLHAPTEGPGHATRIVADCLRERPDVVAVCGGDGTVSEAAAALLGTDVPLAILPGGTSNVLALELEIPFPLEGARHVLLHGEPRTVRVGMANERPFILMTGVGLDARVMGNMSQYLKRWLGRAGILPAVAREFFRYEFPRLEVEIDGILYPATFAVVCNARHYAGNWIAAPTASIEKEGFDVILFDSRRRRDLAGLFVGMKGRRGAHLSAGLARCVPGRQVRVVSREPYAVEAQIDGDCVLKTPVSCRVSSRSLTILAPPRAASEPRTRTGTSPL